MVFGEGKIQWIKGVGKGVPILVFPKTLIETNRIINLLLWKNNYTNQKIILSTASENQANVCWCEAVSVPHDTCTHAHTPIFFVFTFRQPVQFLLQLCIFFHSLSFSFHQFLNGAPTQNFNTFGNVTFMYVPIPVLDHFWSSKREK